MFEACARHRIVVPQHIDTARSGQVGLLHDDPCEVGRVEGGLDEQPVTGLQPDTDLNRHVGVVRKKLFVRHGRKVVHQVLGSSDI